MKISKSTQARLGLALMAVLVTVAVLTPTLAQLRSGEIGAEEGDRPGPPLYAVYAIFRFDAKFRSCMEQAGPPLQVDLALRLLPEGRAELLEVSGIPQAEALQACLTPVVAAISLPDFEGEPQIERAPFTP